jgi:hypothetical protein
LSEVDVAPEANDEAHVLVENNGKVVRVPKNKVGGVQVEAASIG